MKKMDYLSDLQFLVCVKQTSKTWERYVVNIIFAICLVVLIWNYVRGRITTVLIMSMSLMYC